MPTGMPVTGRQDPIPTGPMPRIERVVLIVHDLPGIATFYESVIGLHRFGMDGEAVQLGTGETVLLELRRDRSARRATSREAGLFHIAFLLPDRPALANWLQHAIDIEQPLLGSADHAVSEALYLADPEGNGVEINADRPSAQWRWRDGTVDMPNDPLDVDGLLQRADDGGWQSMPAVAIGHVHLQVGEIAAAERFYAGTFGLDVTQRYPAATFYAAGGYHHRLATNSWNSRGAGRRDGPATGLAEAAMRFGPIALADIRTRAPDATPLACGGLLIEDPWGTRFRLTPTHDSEESER